jgi:hypothetical protein
VEGEGEPVRGYLILAISGFADALDEEFDHIAMFPETLSVGGGRGENLLVRHFRP